MEPAVPRLAPGASMVESGCATPVLMTPPSHSWAVPFNRPDVPSFDAISADIRECITTGQLTKGPQLAAFEREAAAAVGTSHVVGVSSCTSGLMLVLRAIADRAAEASCLPRRTEVILPSFNFLAAPAAVVWAGLAPVFVDVDPATYTLDPAAVERALSPRTGAILSCHTFGCPCDVVRLAAIAAGAGVSLVVDAAHGLGSEISGRQVGSEGFAQVFSLSPTKLVVAGEGGLIATDCPSLAAAIKTGREYGNDGAYGCDRAGINARMPEISAALGRASLARLPATAAARRAAADAYRESLAGVPGISFQVIPATCRSSWKDFCVAVDGPEAGLSRDQLRVRLADAGIDTRAYYSPPCHRMKAFAEATVSGSLAVTDQLATTLLALPMGGHVSPAVAVRVANEVRRIIVQAREAVPV